MSKSIASFFSKPGVKTDKPISEIEEKSDPMAQENSVEIINKPGTQKVKSSKKGKGKDVQEVIEVANSESNSKGVKPEPSKPIEKKMEYKTFKATHLESEDYDAKK